MLQMKKESHLFTTVRIYAYNYRIRMFLFLGTLQWIGIDVQRKWYCYIKNYFAPPSPYNLMGAVEGMDNK